MIVSIDWVSVAGSLQIVLEQGMPNLDWRPDLEHLG